jgi:Flp pilus assembly protein TadD
VAVALVAGLATATALRNRAYRDEVAFWEDVAAKSPHSARAHNNLGVALAGRCRTAEAEASFHRALEADPGHFRSAVNLELLSEGKALGPRAPPCRPAP